MKKNTQKTALGAWGFGANFLPSNAINQLEMWQGDTFSPDVIDRELGWAEAIGMSLMRVFLHDLAYEQDVTGFFHRVETYLDIAERHHIRTAFVFYDDCWLPNPAVGVQPAPKPFTHNSGWVQSPGEEMLAHPENWGRLKAYVQDVLRHFDGDERILMWDLYNEPRPFPRVVADDIPAHPFNELLLQVFQCAQEIRPSQPLTVDVWSWNPVLADINRLALELSDVLSFHCYARPEVLENQINVFRFLAEGRPLICTEYMARTNGSTFEECLRILRKSNVPALNWGLVAGKSNTIYPWGWTEEKGNPPCWFHDVFKADGSLLYPVEKEVFETVSSK